MEIRGRSFRSLALVAALFAVPVSMATASPPAPNESAAPAVPEASPRDSVALTAAPSFAFRLDSLSIKAPTMRFAHPGDVAQADSTAERNRPIFSERTRKAIQNQTFDRALMQTFNATSFEPHSFAGAMLDELLSFAGPDNVKESARAYGLKAERYRLLLRAIDGRIRSS